MTGQRFNIRVYGLLINERNEVLLSDEQRFGQAFTKFPGGGLEWGEGTVACLQREFLEEFNLVIEVGELFYFTDFFQQSAFREEDQVLSVYYRIHIPTQAIDHLLQTQTANEEQLRWLSLNDLSTESVTFPIDRIVAGKLANP